ncbi:MAG: glycosyltransferase family 2 protein, partial [Armatimonadetes bacterium]|nr:glycosyltransferase family 2 protein [Armatimonadota bacterium]
WQPNELTVRLEVVFQPRNMLKGTSVKLGINMAEGEYLVVQDADLEYDPHDIIRLLECAECTGALAVFGSRVLGRRADKSPLNLYALGRCFLSYLFRVLYGANITDVATCYKLMRSDVAKGLRLRSKGFELDFEIPALLRLKGVEIIELPISYKPRSVFEGKKLRPWDGLKAVYVMLLCRVRGA